VERGLYIGGGGQGAGDRRWRRPTSEGDSSSEREGVEGARVVSRCQGGIRGGEGVKRGVGGRNRGAASIEGRPHGRRTHDPERDLLSVAWAGEVLGWAGEGVVLGQKGEMDG
jgi:hypothetical protein